MYTARAFLLCVHTRDERIQMRASADGQTLQTYTLARNTPTYHLPPKPPTHAHTRSRHCRADFPDSLPVVLRRASWVCWHGGKGCLHGLPAPVFGMKYGIYTRMCAFLCVCGRERARTHTSQQDCERVHTYTHA